MESLAYLHLALTYERDCPLCGGSIGIEPSGVARLGPNGRHINIHLPAIAQYAPMRIEIALNPEH